MSFLGASQQHTLQHISELLVELRQLINAPTTNIMPTRFEQRSLTEEPPDSLDVCSPQLSTWHTRPRDESRQRRTLPCNSNNSLVQPLQPTVASSKRTWRPPPSRTTGEFVPRIQSAAPLFNGDDPLGWIFGIQDYFNYFVTDESVRLAVVEKIIEQPALDWFRYYQKNNVDGSWEDFLVAVYYHFSPDLIETDDERQLVALDSEEVVIANDTGTLSTLEEPPCNVIPFENLEETVNDVKVVDALVAIETKVGGFVAHSLYESSQSATFGMDDNEENFIDDEFHNGAPLLIDRAQLGEVPLAIESFPIQNFLNSDRELSRISSSHVLLLLPWNCCCHGSTLLSRTRSHCCK